MLSKIVALSLAAAASAFAPAALPGRVTTRGEQQRTGAPARSAGRGCVVKRAASRGAVTRAAEMLRRTGSRCPVPAVARADRVR